MLLIGGSYADTANNSFASVSGKGVVADGESGFCIKNVEGTVEITVNERPGWKCEKGAPYGYAHNEGDVDNIRFDGLDDEETATISISNVWECVHETTNIDYHVSSPGAEDKGPFHMIAAYSSPASKGAALSFDRSIVLEGRVGHHTNIVIALRCPNPKCDYGIKNPIEESDIVVDPSPVVASADMPEGGILQANGRIVYPQGTHKVCYKADFSNDCEKCGFHKEVLRTIDVYKATSTADEYVGLDRTDAGYAKEHTMSGSVTLKAIPPHVAFNWNVWPHCKIKDNNDGESVVCIVKRIAGDVPGGKDFEYSSRYRQERLSCGINIWDDCTPNCKADTSTTNNFTVVKVDVVIDDLSESLEEEEGAFTYYVPDGDAPIWAEEWTNSLKDVSITCEPHDGEMSNQIVRLKFPEKHLYAKNKDGVYVEAKTAYTVEELNKTKFKLHGHKKSGSYKDKEIVAIHEKSLAIDKAKFTVFGRPLLVPDYDRKNGIDDNDIAKAKEGKTIFRFWINDDDDAQRESWYNIDPFDNGDTMEKGLHFPENGGGNSTDKRVNGRCDLVDFTPVLVDISDTVPREMPDEIMRSFKWVLESDCLRVVWTDLIAGEAGKFLTNEVSHCGAKLKSQSYSADSEEIGSELEFDTEFAKKIQEEGKLVVLVEGRGAGRKFKIKGKLGDGRVLTKGAVNINVSSVREMIRWINLRKVTDFDDRSEQSNFQQIPKNRPDAECEALDSRHFVFVHGYNINSEEALGWSCECFKRMWQSGYNGKFTGVDWYGDQSQIWIPFIGNKSPKYWPNVEHAFKSARSLRRNCDSLTGDLMLMAHSLGNILVSAAISDTGWTDYKKYYMLNAAVAQQAFCNEELRNDDLVPEEWRGVNPKYWVSHWFRCGQFTHPDDFRKTLNWIGRFTNVANKVSYYSQNENVVSSRVMFPVWKEQEMTKGELWGSEAGWAVNVYFSEWKMRYNTTLAAASKLMIDRWMVEKPLFEPFESYKEKMHSLNPYLPTSTDEDEHMRAYYLARAIPATSISVGGGKPAAATGIKDNLYEPYEGPEWPRDAARWDHSDFICVAYYHLKGFYDALVNGNCSGEDK